MKILDWLNRRVDESKLYKAETVEGSVEQRLATKILAYHLGVSYIADTISKCEVKHFVNGEETKDKFYFLFNISPNINQNAFQLKTKLIHKLFYDNEALLFENGGNLYVADSFSVEYNPIKGDKFTNISLDNDTKTYTRKASDVFYFKLDDKKLKNLVFSMLDDFSEMLSHSMNTYKSNNLEKYKLILDEVKVGDQEFNENFEKVIKKQLETFINSEKAVYPQFKGQNLERFSTGDGKTDSTDVRNLRKEIFESVAEALKMPVSMLYGNMTNVEDIISSYITFRIDPLAEMISEELTRKTATMEEILKGSYFKVDTTRIMHIDIMKNASNIFNLIASGTFNNDDVRGMLDYNPLNTEFSGQYWITKNLAKVEDMLNSEVDTKGGE